MTSTPPLTDAEKLALAQLGMEPPTAREIEPDDLEALTSLNFNQEDN